MMLTQCRAHNSKSDQANTFIISVSPKSLNTHFSKRCFFTEGHILYHVCRWTHQTQLPNLIPQGNAGIIQPLRFQYVYLENPLTFICRPSSEVFLSSSVCLRGSCQATVRDLIRINDTVQIKDFNTREIVHSWLARDKV